MSDILLGEERIGVGVALDLSSLDEPNEDHDLPLSPVPNPSQAGTGALGAPSHVDLDILKGERQRSDEIRPKGGRTVSLSEHRVSPPRPD